MIAYKTERIEREFLSPKMRPDLRLLVCAIAGYRHAKYKKRTVITCIHRSQKENKDVGAKSQTHPEWRAVDLRARDCDAREMEDVKTFIESIVEAGQKIVVVVPHGTAPHFHIQVPRWKLKFKNEV